MLSAAAQLVPDFLVDQLIVGLGGLPAHSTDEAYGFHSSGFVL